MTTVWKSAKGLLMRSLRAFSGVKLSFEWPGMTMRSPVLMLTLSRSRTSMSLKVPKPFILTILSAVTFSMMASKNVLRNASASFCGRFFFCANVLASCWRLILVAIVLLHFRF